MNTEKVVRNFLPFRYAMSFGGKEIVREILQKNIKIDDQDENGKTILHYAVKSENLIIVEEILNYNPDINNTGNSGSLLIALNGKGDKNKKIVQVLLEYGFKVNTKDENSYTAMHLAAKNGCKEIVQLLLQFDAEFDSATNDAETPLHLCTKIGNKEICKILLNQGADVNAINKNRYTALHIATQHEYEEVIKLLLEFGAEINSKIPDQEITPLYYFARRGNKEMCKLLLDNEADVNIVQTRSDTALHIAARNGFQEIVKLLLEFGAKVNFKTHDGMTPLHISAKKGRTEVCKVLLNERADVNAEDRNACTALHFASKYGYQEIVKILLDFGANVNSKTNNGKKLLHEPASLGRREIRKYASADADETMGYTALHFASEHCHRAVVRTLLGFNANVNSKAVDGVTPLHLSATMKFFSPSKHGICKMLLNKGADVNAERMNSETALSIAIKDRDYKLIRILLEYGAEIDLKINDYTTIFYHFADNQEAEICELLLKKGAVVNGKLALRYAIECYHKKLVKLLLEFGVEVDCYNDRPINFCTLIYCHLVKRKAANLFVSEKNLQFFSNTLIGSDFQKKCENEVLCLKYEKINNTDISFFDILTKDCLLAMYMKNENIVQTSKSLDYKIKFPIYGNMIECNFIKGVRRMKLINLCYKIDVTCNNFKKLSQYDTEIILSYLNDKDLSNLIQALLA